MKNFVYGKTMEDPERRVDIKLVVYGKLRIAPRLDEKTIISKSHFRSATKLNDNFYAIQIKKFSVLFS